LTTLGARGRGFVRATTDAVNDRVRMRPGSPQAGRNAKDLWVCHTTRRRWLPGEALIQAGGVALTGKN